MKTTHPQLLKLAYFPLTVAVMGESRGEGGDPSPKSSIWYKKIAQIQASTGPEIIFFSKPRPIAPFPPSIPPMGLGASTKKRGFCDNYFRVKIVSPGRRRRPANTARELLVYSYYVSGLRCRIAVLLRLGLCLSSFFGQWGVKVSSAMARPPLSRQRRTPPPLVQSSVHTEAASQAPGAQQWAVYRFWGPY